MYRHAQLLGEKASTPEILELKTEGVLEHSEVFFPQSWHDIPFLTCTLMKEVGSPVLETAYY